MQSNILEYLEQTEQRFPNKLAYADEHSNLTFKNIRESAEKIGSHLIEKGAEHEPVIVYMRKSPETVATFFGIIYAGCYYVPIDDEMPARRIELILENTAARYLIYDESTSDKLEKLNFQGEMISYQEFQTKEANKHALHKVRSQALDTDPIYIVFTSGSTGIPKGVVGHHRGLIDYIDNLCDVLNFDENCVFGNQTPLYVDACMKEIYSTLKVGATTYIIPKQYFMLPVRLVEYMNEKKINTICWVVSALTMISAYGTFDEVKPLYLKTVAFGSEVFPIKQFNLWKKTLPDVEYFNLYGPTEATGVNCYYHATRTFEEGEAIPIGTPFYNTRILLLDENGKEVAHGEKGEICIKGTCLTHGYYKDMERTKEVFVQNPTNNLYPELIYKTADLGYYNEKNELVFVSRKDYQIKHMGHRIELGEIEADVNILDGVKSCCCIFVKETNKIVLFYTGVLAKSELTVALKQRLPRYMLPNAYIQMDALPLTSNGKADRLRMTQIYLENNTKKRNFRKEKENE